MKTIKLVQLYTFILLAFCGVWAAGCSGDADPALATHPAALTMPAAGGDMTFAVTANVGWTVTSDAAWVTAVKAGEGTVKIHAEANEGAARTGNVICTGGGIEVKVSVSQGTVTATQSDSLVLVALYNAANGYEWTAPKWDLAKPVAQWGGVGMAGGRVVKLNLAGRNLKGALPAAIGNLSKLEYCDLGTNQLSGEIPASMNQLTELRFLDLMKNSFTGAIPSLSGLVKLNVLDVSDNKFTAAAVPAFISTLPALHMVIMRHAGLAGALPATLPATVHTLDLSFNALAGAIPGGWNTLTKMEVLFLYGNTSLNGGIPSFTGFNALTSLALDGNEFTGNIPVSFAHLPLLSELWLTNNKLSGAIDNALLSDPRWSKWQVCAGNNFTNCAGDLQEAAGVPHKAAPPRELPYPSKAKYQQMGN